MAKASKPFTRHMATLQSGVVDEGFIRGLRNAAHKLERENQRYSTSRTASKMTWSELDVLLEAIRKSPPRIAPKQSDKGIAYLRNFCWTPKGKLRSRNPLSTGQLLAIGTKFSHFTLQGFEQLLSTSAFDLWVPIYGVHTADGLAFCYYCAAWQSGGAGPVVI